ncbi:MAG: hypothetical protein V4684_19420 [Pseudomonadota bacterium]
MDTSKIVFPTQSGVVIYGPEACGKTTHAAALAAHYRKEVVIDDWLPGDPLPTHALALTNQRCEGAIPFVDAVAFAGINLARRSAT